MVDRETIVSAIEDATTASSIHNSQPWRFRIDGDSVSVSLDASATPRTVDPSGRWALASIGAVVANLELALAARTGREVVTELRLDGLGGDGPRAGGQSYDGVPLAIVTVTEIELGSDRERTDRLADAIRHRFTTREPLLGGPPTQEEWAALINSIAGGTDEIRAEEADPDLALTLLRLTAAAEVERQDDIEYLEEIEKFIAPGSNVGIPRSAVGLPDAEGRVPTRDFTQTPMGAAGTGEAVFFEPEPALLLLVSAGDSPREQFLAGHAMEKIMLEATALELGIGVLGQGLETDESRSEADAATSQVLGRTVAVHQILRLGHPAGALTHPRTPRRPVAEVILD